MAAGPEVFQGATKVITVQTNIDLAAATEIEFRIDTCPTITKTMTGGGISGLSATEFKVTIEPEDTESIKAGVYKYQARATVGASKIQGRFKPNKLTIKESVFTTGGSGNDYN